MPQKQESSKQKQAAYNQKRKGKQPKKKNPACSLLWSSRILTLPTYNSFHCGPGWVHWDQPRWAQIRTKDLGQDQDQDQPACLVPCHMAQDQDQDQGLGWSHARTKILGRPTYTNPPLSIVRRF